ncbi:H-type lectin domain-containing protein [Blautia parvula]|nr:H-type lectin domain-containing protein [Blautia parvula]UBU21824.1 H-type lectin domain-containing protein [Blautia parvula]
MAAIKKSQFKINNGTDWDTYHFETDSAQTKHKKSDGTETTVEEVLNSALGGFMIQTGKIPITPKPNEPTSQHLTFPKKFKSAPVVMLTPSSAVPGTAIQGVSAVNVESSGCDVYITRNNNTETNIMWLAVGPK